MWMPEKELTFGAVRATWTGRVKMWVHYSVLHPWVFPWLSRLSVKHSFWLLRLSRRWLYGPNANNEDLNGLLAQLTQAARAR